MSAPAVAHFRRERVQGRAEPQDGLTVSRRFGVSDPTVAGLTVPGVLDAPVTWWTQIEITGAAAFGLIFEFGSNDHGIKAAISGGVILIAVGSGSIAPAEGAIAVVAIGAVVGQRFDLVVAARPGGGALRVWLEGSLEQNIESTGGTFSVGQWSDSTGGSVGAAANGQSNDRVGITAAPVDFALVGPLTAYYNQLPRQFGP